MVRFDVPFSLIAAPLQLSLLNFLLEFVPSGDSFGVFVKFEIQIRIRVIVFELVVLDFHEGPGTFKVESSSGEEEVLGLLVVHQTAELELIDQQIRGGLLDFFGGRRGEARETRRGAFRG